MASILEPITVLDVLCYAGGYALILNAVQLGDGYPFHALLQAIFGLAVLLRTRPR